jgi:hypothetical protein
LDETGGWRKLGNEELIWMEQETGENYLVRFVSCIFRQILLDKLKEGHAGRIRLKINAYILEDPKLKDPVERWGYQVTWYLCYFGSKLALMNRSWVFGLVRTAESFFTG